jgi:hypothetical protein
LNNQKGAPRNRPFLLSLLSLQKSTIVAQTREKEGIFLTAGKKKRSRIVTEKENLVLQTAFCLSPHKNSFTFIAQFHLVRQRATICHVFKTPLSWYPVYHVVVHGVKPASIFIWIGFDVDFTRLLTTALR